MAEKKQGASSTGNNPVIKQGEKKRKAAPKLKRKDDNLRHLAEKDARQIVAQAYEEAGKIISDAKQKAKNINDNYGEREKIPYADLNNLVKSEHITENSYKQIDDLFVQIKQRLEQTTKGDQLIADDLNNLVLQLEYWVESLVIESMKLKSLERWLKGTKELAKSLREKLDRD